MEMYPNLTSRRLTSQNSSCFPLARIGFKHRRVLDRMAMRMREYAVHADYTHILKYEYETLIHIIHIYLPKLPFFGEKETPLFNTLKYLMATFGTFWQLREDPA